MSDDYDRGYRDGVLAERKRAMLVALRAVTENGVPSTEGHNLAHEIGKAGEMLPREMPGVVDEWTVFGERRLARKLPSFLEGRNEGLTRRGERIARRTHQRLARWSDKKLRAHIEEQNTLIDELQEVVDSADVKRVAELEELVELLTKQLTGTIG